MNKMNHMWMLAALFAATLYAGCSSESNLIPTVPPDSGADTGQEECLFRCGAVGECCGAGEVCSFDHCVPDCEGTRCGADDDICCARSEVCVGGACIQPGMRCAGSGECPEDETCDPVVGRCVPVPEDAACRHLPEPGDFDPVVEWSWDEGETVSVPLVTQLSDDNGDGVVDELDTPDIVTINYDGVSVVLGPPHSITMDNSRITALSGDSGEVLWHSDLPGDVCARTHPAVGDIDADGEVEVLAMYSPDEVCQAFDDSGDYRVVALSRTGEVEWISPENLSNSPSISLANLDGEGLPEIIVGTTVLAADGSTLFRLPDIRPALLAPNTAAADIDGDGVSELITYRGVYRHNPTSSGTEDWMTPLWEDTEIREAQLAVGHILPDPMFPDEARAQIVLTEPVGQGRIWIRDAITGRDIIDPVSLLVPPDLTALIGPPLLADLDGDGMPEIGFMNDGGFRVMDPADQPIAPHLIWQYATGDGNSSTAVTAFDFDGDGSLEVVLNTECHLVILDGIRGTPLYALTNTSPTVSEYTVVADVDRDGNAELVVPSTDSWGRWYNYRCYARSHRYTGPTRGIRVLGDRRDNWVATRPVWNQHDYHIDNVRDDGTIPDRTTTGWLSHNSWRAQAFENGDAATLSPDLRVTEVAADSSECPERVQLRARVLNAGSRGVAAGLAVGFWAGSPSSPGIALGRGHTDAPLLAGQSTWVTLTLDAPSLEADRTMRFHAEADPDQEVSECHEDNNLSGPTQVYCGGLV